jgi:nitrate reductase (cytochrome), electron transfer subunit
MRLRFAWMVLSACLLGTLLPAHAAPLVDAMRGPTPVGEPTSPPPMPPVENRDQRRGRAFAMQPPTIPHKVDGYQLDKNFNRCLFCHARERTAETQAVPLSVTHYMDRSGNVLAEISPRRFFCLQCHVTQVEGKALVANDFKDATAVMRARDAAPAPKKK